MNSYLCNVSLRYFIICFFTLQNCLQFLPIAHANTNRNTKQFEQITEQQVQEILSYTREKISVRSQVNERGELFAEYRASGIDKKLSPSEQFLVGFFGLSLLSENIQSTIDDSEFELEEDFSNVTIRFVRQDAGLCGKLENNECIVDLGGQQGVSFQQPNKTKLGLFNLLLIENAYAQNSPSDEDTFTKGFLDGLAIDWADDALNAGISAAVGTVIGLFGGLGPLGWAALGAVALYTVGSDMLTMGEHLYYVEYYKAGEVLGDLLKDLVISVASGFAGGKAGKALKDLLIKAAEKSDKFAIVARAVLEIIERVTASIIRPAPENNTSSRNTDRGANDSGPSGNGTTSSNNSPTANNSPSSSSPGNGSRPQSNSSSPQNQYRNDSNVLEKPAVEVMQPKPAPNPTVRNPVADAMGVPIIPNQPNVTAQAASGAASPWIPPTIDDDQNDIETAPVFVNNSPQQSFFSLSFNPLNINISEKTMMSKPTYPTLLYAKDYGEDYVIHLPKGGALEEWAAYQKFQLQGKLGINGVAIPRVELWQKTYSGASPDTPYTDSDPPRTYIFAIQHLPGSKPEDAGFIEESFSNNVPSKTIQTVQAMDRINGRQVRRDWFKDLRLDGSTYYVINNADFSPAVSKREMRPFELDYNQALMTLEENQ